jgi:hypothetical protein
VVTGLSLGCSRALRAFALTLGLVALTLQGLAPLCLGMAGGASGLAGVHSVVLCTIHGYQTIQIGADGKPAPNTPAPDQQSSACPICAGVQGANGFTAPEPVALSIPTHFTFAPPAIASSFASVPKPHFSYISRAPPGWGYTGLA